MVRSTTPLDITRFWLDALGDRNSNSHKLDEVQERNDEKDLHHKKNLHGLCHSVSLCTEVS